MRAGSAPVVWYEQMMGYPPRFDSTSMEYFHVYYDIARKRYRRLLPEVRERERAREAKRVRSADSKNPPEHQPRKRSHSLAALEEYAVHNSIMRGVPYCSKHGYGECDCPGDRPPA